MSLALLATLCSGYFEAVERFGMEVLRKDLTGAEACWKLDVELITEPGKGETGDCEVETEDLGPSDDNRWRDLLRYSRSET